mgnify:CR=1 FL=1
MTESRHEAQGIIKRVMATRENIGFSFKSATPIKNMIIARATVLYLTMSFLLKREARNMPMSPEPNWTELMMRGAASASGDF